MHKLLILWYTTFATKSLKLVSIKSKRLLINSLHLIPFFFPVVIASETYILFREKIIENQFACF